jgi:putative ABC transport system substrate-binding protein
MKILRIGILYPGTQAAASGRFAAFQSGLQAGGLAPEQIEIVPRVTGGNPALLQQMATDLVALKVDLIYGMGPPAVRAAREATSTIPIVAGDLESDPVGGGSVASNTRPGGNITGLFLDFPEFSKKWLEALKEAVPQIASVAVMWEPSRPTSSRHSNRLSRRARARC